MKVRAKNIGLGKDPSSKRKWRNPYIVSNNMDCMAERRGEKKRGVSHFQCEREPYEINYIMSGI